MPLVDAVAGAESGAGAGECDQHNNFYLQFVFDLEYFQWCNGYDLTRLHENTSLQRNLKRYVLNGGKPGAGLGYLKYNGRV